MEYTIKQVSEMTGLSIYTLRYYDKEGLLPQIKRSEGGIRRFSQDDIEWIRLICCLRNSGMPLSQIQKFISLCLMGSQTVEQRRALLEEHRENIIRQLAQLQSSLDTVNYKIAHYKEVGIFHIDCDAQRCRA